MAQVDVLFKRDHVSFICMRRKTRTERKQSAELVRRIDKWLKTHCIKDDLISTSFDSLVRALSYDIANPPENTVLSRIKINFGINRNSKSKAVCLKVTTKLLILSLLES